MNEEVGFFFCLFLVCFASAAERLSYVVNVGWGPLVVHRVPQPPLLVNRTKRARRVVEKLGVDFPLHWIWVKR